MRAIRYNGDPVLLQKSTLVDKMTPEVSACIEELSWVLFKTPGAVALAANQLGYPYSAFSFRVNPTDPTKFHEIAVVINPKILRTFKNHSHLIEQEGCMSFPGGVANVKRVSVIDVSFDVPYKHFKTKHYAQYNGYMARIWQHEIDHLNGITILDHLEGGLAKIEFLAGVTSYHRPASDSC